MASFPLLARASAASVPSMSSAPCSPNCPSPGVQPPQEPLARSGAVRVPYTTADDNGVTREAMYAKARRMVLPFAPAVACWATCAHEGNAALSPCRYPRVVQVPAGKGANAVFIDKHPSARVALGSLRPACHLPPACLSVVILRHAASSRVADSRSPTSPTLCALRPPRPFCRVHGAVCAAHARGKAKGLPALLTSGMMRVHAI